jgi:hypothetical protein
MEQVQFPTGRSPQMTLSGQVFTLVEVGAAPIQPATSPESFTTDIALDIPFCEKINDTLGIFTKVENHHTLERVLMR